MKDLDKRILNKLIDKYENSKLSKGGTLINKSIKLSTKDEIFSPYNSFDSYKYADAYDAVIKQLEKQNYIKAFFEGETFKSLILNLDNVESVYEFLGREKPADELNSIRKVLNNYSFGNFVDSFKEYVNDYIDNKYDYPRTYFTNSEQLDLLLDTFKKIFTLKNDIKKRDFSAKYLGDSKLFESIQGKIIRIIKDFDGNTYSSDDDVLAEYNIVQNSSYAMIKNNLVLKINNSIINLDDLGHELLLSDSMIESLEILDSNVNKVITVENLTSFYSLNDNNAVIIYLGGFHNHTKQSLLLKIHDKYPNSKYYHFGDIDAGGILIYYNLVEKTGINFIPYCMGIEELINNKSNLKKLTDNDKRRLSSMLNDKKYTIFRETIRYMIENDVKMEQELLD